MKSIIDDQSPESSNDYHRLSSFYYPVPASANEANAYGANLLRNAAKPSELMELSASNYYPPSDESYGEFSSVTTLPTADEFEFEKINPSDIMNINKNETLTGELADESLIENRPNVTQLQASSYLEGADSQKYSKLLFSSPSATVTSNGASGPFKAIICHDCDNSEGRNVGHSVSFSAIKSWNVGSSNTARQLEQIEANHTLGNDRDEIVDRVKAPDKYFETNQQIAREENRQIEMNDNVELYKVENVSSETEKPSGPANTWNYSLLPINNENVKHNSNIVNNKNNNNNNNNPSTSTASQRKPIFNDLLKVPYDILNAPLTETPSLEPVKSTQIHINHQQKFNDTITSNYQHFQQFIQKNLKPNTMQHYQSTPMPEQNYEVDESVSLMTNGRAHGVQSTTARVNSHVDDTNTNLPANIPHQEQEQDAKFGYVVEGRNFRKYRVEEKTADGFIVG